MVTWEPQADGTTDRALRTQHGGVDENGDIVDFVETLHERLREAITADDETGGTSRFPLPRGVV